MNRKGTDRPTQRGIVLTLVLTPVLVLGLAAAARGQQPGGPQDPPQPQDSLAEHLFPPDLVMRHQAEIGLSPSQREALIAELQSTQSEIVPLQFDLHEASETLAKLLSASRVDEERVLAQAERVMELERRVRARHLTLLVRVKNLLSAEQQERLKTIRGRGAK